MNSDLLQHLSGLHLENLPRWRGAKIGCPKKIITFFFFGGGGGDAFSNFNAQ